MTEALIISFALVLVRLATFWMVVPIWNQYQPPRTVKLGVVLALSVFWFSQQQQIPEPVREITAEQLNWFGLAAAVAREILIGGALGFAFHAFLVPARIAGAYISQELGLNLATLADPTTPEQTSIVATIFQLSAVTLFFVLDLHHFVIVCLDLTFLGLPVGSGWNVDWSAGLARGFLNLVEQGLTIAAPIGIVLMITLVSLLFLARAVPSLNLFSIGLSVRLAVGIAALVVLLPSLIGNLHNQFELAKDLILSFVWSLFPVA